MTPGAERLLVLSLRLLKTAANERMPNEIKGQALQRISAAQMETLTALPREPAAADSARIALANYFSKVPAIKTQREI